MWVCLISICKYLLTQGGTLGRDYENSLYCKSFSIKKKKWDARCTTFERGWLQNSEGYCLFNSKNAIYSLIKGMINRKAAFQECLSDALNALLDSQTK